MYPNLPIRGGKIGPFGNPSRSFAGHRWWYLLGKSPPRMGDDSRSYSRVNVSIFRRTKRTGEIIVYYRQAATAVEQAYGTKLSRKN